MNEPTEEDVSQELTVHNIEVVSTQRENAKLPTFALEIDVQHTETNHRWRQSLALSVGQLLDLVKLLIFSAKSEGIDPDG